MALVPGRRRLFGGVRKPTLPSSPPAPSEPEVVEDEFSNSIPGVVRLNLDSARPNRVAPAVWAEVFPLDYERVRRRTGRLFLSGMNPDEAVRKANREIHKEVWHSEPYASWTDALRECFPDCWDDEEDMPLPHLARTVEAISSTARSSGAEILSAKDPERAAFKFRRWFAPPGHCIVCDSALGPEDTRFAYRDGIHGCCKTRMRTIGPTFGRLVIEEARRLAENPPTYALIVHEEEPED